VHIDEVSRPQYLVTFLKASLFNTLRRLLFQTKVCASRNVTDQIFSSCFESLDKSKFQIVLYERLHVVRLQRLLTIVLMGVFIVYSAS
jgi:hypothetical protein